MQIMDPTTHLWLVEQDRERAMTQRALERAARAGGSPRPGEIRGGISLAKLFLYDLAFLSSVARAFSFLAVGGVLLAAGFFYQRLAAVDSPA